MRVYVLAAVLSVAAVLAVRAARTAADPLVDTNARVFVTGADFSPTNIGLLTSQVTSSGGYSTACDITTRTVDGGASAAFVAYERAAPAIEVSRDDGGWRYWVDDALARRVDERRLP